MWGRRKMWGRHHVFTMHFWIGFSFFSNSFSCLSGGGRRADQVECCSSKWFSLIPMRIAGEGEEKRPRAMSLSVKAMVATAASHPKMWGRQKMWGRRPFGPKMWGRQLGSGKGGDVDRMWGRRRKMKMWGRRQDSGDVPTFSVQTASQRVAGREGGREGGRATTYPHPTSGRLKLPLF